MKKSLLAVAAAAVTALAPLAIPTAASAADTPTCVTRAEYRAVHKGYTKAHVARIFDVPGHREARATGGGFVSEVRSYRTCSRFSAVTISFSGHTGGALRLDAKSAIWIS